MSDQIHCACGWMGELSWASTRGGVPVCPRCNKELPRPHVTSPKPALSAVEKLQAIAKDAREYVGAFDRAEDKILAELIVRLAEQVAALDSKCGLFFNKLANQVALVLDGVPAVDRQSQDRASSAEPFTRETVEVHDTNPPTKATYNPQPAMGVVLSDSVKADGSPVIDFTSEAYFPPAEIHKAMLDARADPSCRPPLSDMQCKCPHENWDEQDDRCGTCGVTGEVLSLYRPVK